MIFLLYFRTVLSGYCSKLLFARSAVRSVDAACDVADETRVDVASYITMFHSSAASYPRYHRGVLTIARAPVCQLQPVGLYTSNDMGSPSI